MMSEDPLAALRRTNEYLRSSILRLQADQTVCSTIRPQNFTDLLNEILRMGQCLRSMPSHPPKSAAIQEESAQYLANLESLKNFLPQLHGRLLAEKSRLEIARNHAAAAAAWASASKETL
jgi:hypothetical protein